MIFGLPPRRQRPNRYWLAVSTVVALVLAAVLLLVVLNWAGSYEYP